MNKRGKVVWFTGLSGAGKTTLAHALSLRLNERHIKNVELDGDTLRLGLSADLGFSDPDRTENVRRVREISKLLVEQGLVVIVAMISPFKRDRDDARKSFEVGDFAEVYVNTDLEVCKARDVKGLYSKALKNEVPQFTGLTSLYEAPNNPEMIIHTKLDDPAVATQKLMDWLLI